MIHVHGVLLKMSMDNRELGGYKSYFTEWLSANLSRMYSVELTNYPAWALKVMSLWQFKQIRAAFHPETGQSRIGDKCHQLRHALNTLNSSSYRTFIPGKNLSFDEGVVASWSRFNPVRQYNKDKPQKFRVDFFVLCNNSPGAYFIVHCDVYQWKKRSKHWYSYWDSELTYHPKGSGQFHHPVRQDPDGIRCVFVDNCYSCTNPFVLLCEKFAIICAGSTRVNRVGCPKDVMTLTKSA